VIETGRLINEIAKELEIHEGTLGHWIKRWKDENPEPETASTRMEDPGRSIQRTTTLTPKSQGCNHRLNLHAENGPLLDDR